MDHARLGELGRLPSDQIASHADQVILTRPSSRSLYRRWEQQQWSAEEVVLDRDLSAWKRLPAGVRGRLEKLLINFLVGEYTGLDLLSPLLLACPDEDSLVYLGTQLADESRHTRLMQRLATELLGLPDDLEKALPAAWEKITPAQHELSVIERDLISRLNTARPSYVDWIRAVTVFHLVTESVLALHAQRTLVASLRPGGMLPGLRAGFVAMTRDESRHVAYGMQALRQGLVEGQEEAIVDVLATTLPLAVLVELDKDPSAAEVAQVRLVAGALKAEGVRRMHQLGISASAQEHVVQAMDRAIDGLADAQVRSQS